MAFSDSVIAQKTFFTNINHTVEADAVQAYRVVFGKRLNAITETDLPTTLSIR